MLGSCAPSILTAGDPQSAAPTGSSMHSQRSPNVSSEFSSPAMTSRACSPLKTTACPTPRPARAAANARTVWASASATAANSCSPDLSGRLTRYRTVSPVELIRPALRVPIGIVTWEACTDADVMMQLMRTPPRPCRRAACCRSWRWYGPWRCAWCRHRRTSAGQPASAAGSSSVDVPAGSPPSPAPLPCAVALACASPSTSLPAVIPSVVAAAVLSNALSGDRSGWTIRNVQIWLDSTGSTMRR